MDMEKKESKWLVWLKAHKWQILLCVGLILLYFGAYLMYHGTYVDVTQEPMLGDFWTPEELYDTFGYYRVNV